MVAGAPCQVRLPRLVPVPPKPVTIRLRSALFWCALVDGLLVCELHDRRCIRPANASLAWPLVDLRTFRDRNFTVGCVLSFVLGIGLFGSVYLMPVFLAYVRGHSAFEVGMIILVTGVVQFVTAPIAARSSSATTSAI